MLIDVRSATPLDIDWLMSRLLKLSQFAGTKRLLFEDNDYSRNGLASLIAHHFVRVAYRKHEAGWPGGSSPLKEGWHRVGFIGGYFVGHPFNPKVRYLSELFWWVDETDRKTRAGHALLKSFVDFGIANADWLVFGLNEHTPVKEETILKIGFKKHETCYLMEIE